MYFPNEATGTELGLGLSEDPLHCQACVSVLCPPHPNLGLQWQREDVGGWGLTSEPSSFQRGKSFPELFEFLQKEEEVGGSTLYLLGLCRTGLSRPASCFRGSRHCPQSSKSLQCPDRGRKIRLEVASAQPGSSPAPASWCLHDPGPLQQHARDGRWVPGLAGVAGRILFPDHRVAFLSPAGGKLYWL